MRSRVDERGRMIGDMFDGEGFVRGVMKKRPPISPAQAFLSRVAAGGSAIAAAVAKAGVSRLGLYDTYFRKE